MGLVIREIRLTRKASRMENGFLLLCFLLGYSQTSEFYTPTFWNILFHLHRQVFV
jgi:hypothetical protein